MFAVAKLFFQLGSGLLDAVAARIGALPVVRGLNVTVNVADWFAPSEASCHVTTLRHQIPPLLLDTRVSDDGSASATDAFFATAGPALRTVRVQVAFTLIFTDAGHDNAAERSARFDAGGGELTVTLCGPAVADPAPFVAMTEYVNVVVPAGGVPPTRPLIASIDSHVGAPVANE